MEKSFWGRLHDLKTTINGGVQPMDEIRLPTKTIKISLGLFLLQSIIVAFVWSLQEKNMSPWIIPLSTVLQVGWIWNKITDSWKIARGYYRQLGDSLKETREPEAHEPEPLVPPTIILHTQAQSGTEYNTAVNSIVQTNETSWIQAHPLQ